MLNVLHAMMRKSEAPGEVALDLSIVVPVYQSAQMISGLVERIQKVIGELKCSAEVILVEDGSSDHSWKIVTELQRRFPRVVRPIQLMRNFGQHNALMCGLHHIRGRVVVTIDDDGQNPPEEIPKMLQRLEDGNFDVVYGVPREKRHAWGRNLGSNLVNMFFQIVFQTNVTVTSFRAVRRNVVDAIRSYDLNFTYIDGLLAWNTRRIGSVTVYHQPRSTGRSGYTLARLITLALNLFTNFSLVPLQIATVIGFIAALGGLGTGAFYLVQAMVNQIAVPGYASIIVAVLTLGGLHLLALGIIGEYIGRLHLNVNRKPQYTIRQVLSVDESDK
jgi:undecaprenyl-phosphate 4-deoxy-4-formamido-L-arabinose transferase